MAKRGSGTVAPTRIRTRNLSGKNQKWTLEEDTLLYQIFQGNADCAQWKSAAAFFPGKTSQQLFERWTKVLDPRLLKGSWSRDEDEAIIKHVAQSGCTSWSKLAETLPGRLGKQCRERWFNHLNPVLSRGQWTPDEDEQIMRLHEQFGNHWSQIAAQIPARGDNMIKNRWYSTLSKKSKEEVSQAAESYRLSPESQMSAAPSPPIHGQSTVSGLISAMGIENTPVWTRQGAHSARTTVQFPSPSMFATPDKTHSPFPGLRSMFGPSPSDGHCLSAHRQEKSPAAVSGNVA
jgi:hypothetical protein